MRAKTLKSHTLITSAETHLGAKRRLKVVREFQEFKPANYDHFEPTLCAKVSFG